MMPSFVDGLSLAMQLYGLAAQEIRLHGIEDHLADLALKQRNHDEEIYALRQSIEKLSRFQRNIVLCETSQFLDSLQPSRANVHSVQTLCDFIYSMGTTILAITVSGKGNTVVKGTMFKRKVASIHSTLITTGMDTNTVLKSLRKIAAMRTITSATIVTKRLDSHESIRLTSLSICSFLKVLHILGHTDAFLTDKSQSNDQPRSTGPHHIIKSKHENNSVHIKFEGAYNLKEYNIINNKRHSMQYNYLQNNKNNVYILGPNGAGKSTWANLFVNNYEFEVGDSIHTTLIPESIDFNINDSYDSTTITRKKEVRLWDTPGLFDGSDEQYHMENHMDKIINQHMYFLCVIFIFNASHQSNKITTDILTYAAKRFGNKVKTNFIAIVNDKNDGKALYTIDSYWNHLQQYGYKVSNDTFYVSNIKNEESDVVISLIKEKFSGNDFKPSFVAKHREFFDNLTSKNNGNFQNVLKDVNQRSHEQLKQFIENGKIRVAINDVEGFFSGHPPCRKISLRQYETRYFLRKIGYGNKTPVDQKVIFIDQSLKWSDNSSINLLNRTTPMEQRRIFLNHVVNNCSNILMTSTSEDCDFILFDYAKMNPQTRKETMEMHILNNKKFGLDSDDDSQSDASSSSLAN